MKALLILAAMAIFAVPVDAAIFGRRNVSKTIVVEKQAVRAQQIRVQQIRVVKQKAIVVERQVAYVAPQAFVAPARVVYVAPQAFVAPQRYYVPQAFVAPQAVAAPCHNGAGGGVLQLNAGGCQALYAR